MNLCMNYSPHSRPNSQRDCLNSIKRLDDSFEDESDWDENPS